MSLPDQITRDQAEAALRALGVTGMHGLAAVYIDAREETVVLTTRVTGENGEYLLFDGDCAFQEHVIPVVEGPTERGGSV